MIFLQIAIAALSRLRPLPATQDDIDDLKAEIEQMESKLYGMRQELYKTRDAADNSGQKGYYRLAAEIENFKAAQDKEAKRQKEKLKAQVIRDVMPVIEGFEELQKLELTPGQERIRSSFNAVWDAMMRQFTTLGMETFHITPGEEYDPDAHDANIDDIPSVTNIVVDDEIRPGYKLSTTGAVIRKAICTAKLGPDRAPPEKVEDA